MENPKFANFPPPPEEYVPYSEKNPDPTWATLLDQGSSSVPGKHETMIGLSPKETVQMAEEAERTDAKDEAQYDQEIDRALTPLENGSLEGAGNTFVGSEKEITGIRRKLSSETKDDLEKRQERDKRVEARISARLANPDVRRQIMQGDITIEAIIQEEEARKESDEEEFAA